MGGLRFIQLGKGKAQPPTSHNALVFCVVHNSLCRNDVRMLVRQHSLKTFAQNMCRPRKTLEATKQSGQVHDIL